MNRLFVLGSVLVAAVTFAQDRAPSVTLPEMPAVGAPVPLPEESARQFDHWLGEWNVQNKHVGDDGWADTGKARALIQPVAGGAAVLEQWTGALNGDPLIGFSLRAFDPKVGKWAIWLNWHGGRPGGFFPMQGIVDRDAGRIELFPHDDMTSTRYSFSQAREGSMQWDEARSSDGGKTWATRWIMQFTRAEDPLPVDATNAPIVAAPPSAEGFADTRRLDWLVGAWEGPARIRDGKGAAWRDVGARARVTNMIQGFALLQYVDTDDGTKTMAALGQDTRAKAWVALSVDGSGNGIRYLTGEPGKRAVTFTSGGDAPDLREAWACDADDTCTFRRETSADGGKSWDVVFEANLARSVSTAAFIPIPRVKTPFPDVLTGGQLSAEQLRWAARNGYKTVVNTRAPGEEGELADEAGLVRELGMTYVSIPVAGIDDINVENAQRLAKALANEDAFPVIVHCRSGNRVGGLFAVKAHKVDGLSVMEALHVGRAAGMESIEGLIRERLGLPAADD